MSEEIIINGKEEPPKPKSVALNITLAPDGQIAVEAPGNGTFFDEPMCLYLLKKAGQYIENHNAVMAKQQKQNGLVTSAGRFRGLFKK